MKETWHDGLRRVMARATNCYGTVPGEVQGARWRQGGARFADPALAAATRGPCARARFGAVAVRVQAKATVERAAPASFDKVGHGDAHGGPRAFRGGPQGIGCSCSSSRVGCGHGDTSHGDRGQAASAHAHGADGSCATVPPPPTRLAPLAEEGEGEVVTVPAVAAATVAGAAATRASKSLTKRWGPAVVDARGSTVNRVTYSGSQAAPTALAGSQHCCQLTCADSSARPRRPRPRCSSHGQSAWCFDRGSSHGRSSCCCHGDSHGCTCHGVSGSRGGRRMGELHVERGVAAECEGCHGTCTVGPVAARTCSPR